MPASSLLLARTFTSEADGSRPPLCQTHRHLKGPWILYHSDGRPITEDQLWDCCGRWRVARIFASTRPHILRHTFYSHLAMRGPPTRAIQELAGHRDLTTISATGTESERDLRRDPAARNRSTTPRVSRHCGDGRSLTESRWSERDSGERPRNRTDGEADAPPRIGLLPSSQDGSTKGCAVSVSASRCRSVGGDGKASLSPILINRCKERPLLISIPKFRAPDQNVCRVSDGLSV